MDTNPPPLVDEYKLKYERIAEDVQKELARRVQVNEDSLRDVKANYMTRDQIKTLVEEIVAKALVDLPELKKDVKSLNLRAATYAGIATGAGWLFGHWDKVFK